MGVYIRKGSPYFWIDIVPPDGGRRIQRSTKVRHDATTAVLRRENQLIAARMYHEAYTEVARRLVDPEPEPKPARTVTEHADWYRTHRTAHKRGAAREGEILDTLTRAFGPRLLSDVTADAVHEWMTTRRTTVSAATVNRELDVLKSLLASAVPAYLDASPAAGIKRLRVEQRAVVVLSHADEAKLLQALPPADQAIVIAALDTLIRAGDLLRLTWADDHGTFLDVPDPKTGKGYRVPVSRRLRTALDGLKPKRLKRDQAHRTYVFAHRRVADNPRHWTNSLKQMLEDGCRRAGVRYGRKRSGITFHGLRHTGATRMIEAGVSVRTLQAIGGWSDLRQLTRYAHPSDQALIAAVETVSRPVSR